MMVNNDVQTIYLNNVLTGTHTYSMSQLSNAKDLLIGWSLRGGGYEIFKGQIDDIRIYNRVLTDIEILALYQE